MESTMANGAVSATSQQEFSDADFRVADNADQSKKLAFEVSGIATATTRTVTVPDKNLTIQAQAALLDAIAALTTAAGGFIRTTGSDTVAAQAIIGTVSESSGIPTGALVEYGSGAGTKVRLLLEALDEGVA